MALLHDDGAQGRPRGKARNICGAGREPRTPNSRADIDGSDGEEPQLAGAVAWTWRSGWGEETVMMLDGDGGWNGMGSWVRSGRERMVFG